MTPQSGSPPASELRSWLNLPLATTPSVTADGEHVLFVSDESGIPLAWVVPGRGGPARRVADGAERVGQVLAAPAGGRALVSMDHGGNEHWQLNLLEWDEDPGRARSAPLTTDPEVIHSPGRWRPDGQQFLFSSNARDRRFFDVYELTPGSPSSPQLRLQGDAMHGVLAADGTTVLVARANTNLDVDLLLLEGGRTVHLNPHDGEMSVFSADISKSGVLAAANPDREFAALVRYRPGSQHHEFLREYPGDVELVRSAPVGSAVALSVNRQGWSEVHLFDPETGEDRPFPSGPRGVVGSICWYPDASAFVYDVSSVAGQQIYRRDVTTGKERRLAGPMTTPAVTPLPVHRSFAASDRVVVPYWEYAPTGPARGTIVNVHGGPESQARPGFAPVVQFLVSRGWRVILPNIRGSTGYGRRYVHLDDVRRRMDSVRDVKELVDELVRTGKASRGRVGIVGGSYGGFVVLSAASTYPDLWGAAVDIVGIANFVTFLENTGPWRRTLREAEYGSLANDRDFLESISPIRRAEAITAPLFVIHGRNDPRVPVGEAEQVVASVRAKGHPVELLVFDDEGHGIVRRKNREVAWSKVVEWFESYLGQGSS